MIRANPLVREDAGRVAVQRGPLVYCMESPDQAVASPLFDMELTDLKESFGEQFGEQFRRDLLDGVTVLRHRGVVAERPIEDEPLYQVVSDVTRPAVKPIELTLIPYYAWSNRGINAMEIWIPVDQAGNGTR